MEHIPVRVRVTVVKTPLLTRLGQDAPYIFFCVYVDDIEER